MPQTLGSSAHSCLFHIQQSPPYLLRTIHTTLNTIQHTNYTLQTRYMSQISQLSNLAISVAVCITTSIPHTTSPIPQQPNLLLADTFVTKARLYSFFLHQTQSKHDGNVCEKVWRTLFTLSTVLDMLVRPAVDSGGGLATSYTRTSTDSDSTLLSSCIRISSDRNRLGPDSFSLINPQQSV